MKNGVINELALFSGAGGGILGSMLLGWTTICAVEIDAFCARRLMQRQNEGYLSPFPIWDDVCTFDGRPWRGIVDVVSGGFPCQDISCAGTGAGINGKRSGLWTEFARIIREVRPRFVFVENSPMLTSRGLGTVLGDLAEMGYDARWGVLGAIDAGAPHRRDRIWIIAYSDSDGLRELSRRIVGQNWTTQSAESSNDGPKRYFPDAAQIGRGEGRSRRLDSGGSRQQESPLQELSHSDKIRRDWGTGVFRETRREQFTHSSWWESEPDVGRVAHGVAYRVDRLRAIGNGQVPAVAAISVRVLTSINLQCKKGNHNVR